MLRENEALEVATVHSVASRFGSSPAFGLRPFRDPHHTASAAAMVGGGSPPRPGEVSLAHRGVLFLDELPEFDRRVLEVLREPLEAGDVVIARARMSVRFPARFQLVAAMNPCPCGYLGDPSGRCRCTPNSLQRYQARLSGPLLDRIDLRVQLTRVAESEWQAVAGASGPNTVEAAAQVMAARRIQLERSGVLNAALSSAQLVENLGMSMPARQLLLAVSAKMQLSARAKQRVERVARTLADLDASAAIAPGHVAEALQLRRSN